MITRSRDSKLPISRQDVELSDFDILQRYMGISEKLPVTIQSPLREDDKSPSFSFQDWNGTVVWKDFGTGESGSIIGLMARLWNVDYPEALLKIKLDTENRIPRASLIRQYKGKIHLTTNSTIKVRTREWQSWDKEFWGSFGISEKFCKWCNVYPISHAFFTREEDGRTMTVTVPMDKYAYAYFEWKDGNESIKLYQPYSEKMKWLSKHDHSVWDLWKQAFNWKEKHGSSELILTSSRKDAMCLWSTLKVPAMSLQGEGYLPKPQVMKQVLDAFNTVYLWYDNDFSKPDMNPGQEDAAKLIAIYPELRNICIPSEYKAKDPSDLYKDCGKEAVKEVWDNQK